MGLGGYCVREPDILPESTPLFAARMKMYLFRGAGYRAFRLPLTKNPAVAGRDFSIEVPSRIELL